MNIKARDNLKEHLENSERFYCDKKWDDIADVYL
jgi:hypothetical protein